jgi:F0F1-type ATP synthase membrane subunit a
MLAGHILAHVISFYGVALLTNGFFVVYFFIFLLLVILTFMEFFVSIVQPLIFLVLSSIYLEESLACCVN